MASPGLGPALRGPARRPADLPADRRDHARRAGNASLLATCSTRRPMRSRSCAGSGTAGRTTRSSRTSPPAATSTATSSTTSTSREVLQRQGPLDRASTAAGATVVAALAHSRIVFEFAARAADVVFVTPAGPGEVRRWVTTSASRSRPWTRRGAVKVFADINVVLGDSTDGAAPPGPPRRPRWLAVADRRREPVRAAGRVGRRAPRLAGRRG